jgi:hypothetical protein
MPNSVNAKHRRNPRTLVRKFGTLFRELKGTEAATISNEKTMMRILDRSVRKLFQDAELDVYDSNDWITIVYVLALGIYSPKEAGRPRRWSKKQTIQLRTEVDNIRNGNGDLTDLECCEELVKRNASNSRYRVEPSTLLRRLYPEADRKKANTDRGQIKTEGGQAETKREAGPYFGESDKARIVIEHAMRHHDLRRWAA